MSAFHRTTSIPAPGAFDRATAKARALAWFASQKTNGTLHPKSPLYLVLAPTTKGLKLPSGLLPVGPEITWVAIARQAGEGEGGLWTYWLFCPKTGAERICARVDLPTGWEDSFGRVVQPR